MAPRGSADVTALLVAWSAGDDGALAELVPRIYSELHRLAHHYMRGERRGGTIQTTALVNEAYLRLVNTSLVDPHSRSQVGSQLDSRFRTIRVSSVGLNE